MPKLDEDDFVDPGNLPAITQSKSPPPDTPGGMPAMGAVGMAGAMNSSMNMNMGGSTSIGQQFNAAPQVDRNAAGANAAQGADVLVKHSKESEDWINKKWRPVMGWVYMATCTADFVVFPVLWSALQAISHGAVNTQWNPITLQGAGLYHIAMGAVLGIAAYGRTKEKLEQKQ
jgi:hypothetical protein